MCEGWRWRRLDPDLGDNDLPLAARRDDFYPLKAIGASTGQQSNVPARTFAPLTEQAVKVLKDWEKQN